jgi:hypothetical protein
VRGLNSPAAEPCASIFDSGHFNFDEEFCVSSLRDSVRDCELWVSVEEFAGGASMEQTLSFTEPSLGKQMNSIWNKNIIGI